jgi:aquaporin Z
MRKYAVEFIGTFFLLLVIALSVLQPGAGAMAPLAIGSILMVMVYAGGYISGGHYNPAVTLGAWLRGKVPGKDLLPYWVAQFLGAIAASLVAIGIKGVSPAVAPVMNSPTLFLVEFFFAFALVYTVLHTATSRQTEGNSYFGLAIGFTVMAGAYATGALSGAAFNPAVAVGLTITGLSAPGYLWIYFVANLLAGAAAALVFNAMNRERTVQPPAVREREYTHA